MKKLHNNLFVSGQITPNDFQTMSDAGITVIINNRPDNEESGQLSAADAAELAIQQGIEYHYLPMVNGQPLPPTLVEDFKVIIDSTDQPILAHCRSGMRSSFLWALGQIPLGKITVDDAIDSAQAAGISLNNARAVLESVQPR